MINMSLTIRIKQFKKFFNLNFIFKFFDTFFSKLSSLLLKNHNYPNVKEETDEYNTTSEGRSVL